MASLLQAHEQAGDEGSFDVLYRTYRSEVHRLASYLLRNTSDAEDASQTVFLNVLRALRQGVTPTDPRAWLLAITRNVCFSRRRAVACRPDEIELDPETVGDAGDNGGPNADDIVGALARMLPNQRTALILRDFRGVPRTEISELLALSPTGVEALLTRARASFREELEADQQPFDCAETRALVEQQLEGLITVAERHSLRAHLRHCSPCSTLARAARSSRGKLAGLLFWPGELISRLASAFSQAPSAVHVAAAVSSAAVVAGVAMPVAILHAPSANHVEGRAAPRAAIVAHNASPSLTPLASTSASSASKAPARKTVAHKPAAHSRVHVHAVHSAAPTNTPITATPPSRQPVAADTPSTATLISSTRTAQAPTVTRPVAVSPRSSSPAARPARAKPKPNTARRGSKRRGRHAPAPRDTMPRSSAPADALPPEENGADNGAGPGFDSGTSAAPAAVPASESSASSSSSSTSSGSASSGSDASSSSSSDSSDSGHGKAKDHSDKEHGKHK